MSIISYIPFARFFKTANKSSHLALDNIPNSARRAIERSNQPQPYTINRDAHGSRPWHSYKAKKASQK